MYFSKTYFCDMCLILVLGFGLIQCEEIKIQQSLQDDVPKGNCSCGGFPTANPTPDMSPLLSQMPGLVVKCDQSGASTCKDLCTALATATKAKGPEILCNKLKTADELFLSACYKICDKPWAFAGMTAEQPLCCEDSKIKVCASVQNQVNATEDSRITL